MKSLRQGVTAQQAIPLKTGTSSVKNVESLMSNKILPNAVKVGPYVFSVLEQGSAWQLESEIYGKVVYERLEIHVGVDNPPAVILDTFLHELLHTVTYTFTIHGDEEACVSAAATGLTGVFVDNPDMLTNIKRLVAKVRKGY
jgi:hypothetical protein